MGTLHHESCVEDVHNVIVVAGKFSFREGNVKEKMLTGKKDEFSRNFLQCNVKMPFHIEHLKSLKRNCFVAERKQDVICLPN